MVVWDKHTPGDEVRRGVAGVVAGVLVEVPATGVLVSGGHQVVAGVVGAAAEGVAVAVAVAGLSSSQRHSRLMHLPPLQQHLQLLPLPLKCDITAGPLAQ